jgi:hypothetical protein
VKSTLKGISCFLLIPSATSESAFRSLCAMKELQVYLLNNKSPLYSQTGSQE